MNLYKEKSGEYKTNSICFVCRAKGNIAAHCPSSHLESVGAQGQTQQLVPPPSATTVVFSAPADSQPTAVGPTTGSIMAIAMPPGGEVTYYPKDQEYEELFVNTGVPQGGAHSCGL